MKYKIIFFLMLTLFGNCLAHNNQNVHQRIVVEAYNLLKLQLSKENSGIADIDDYIGEIRRHEDNYWRTVNTITGGSDHEDRCDIMYNYSWPRESITHFLDSDKPLEGTIKIYDGCIVPSAYIKAQNYIWDSWTKVFEFHLSGGFEKRWSSREPNSYLYQYYWKDKIWINYSHHVYWYNAWIPNNKMHNYFWECGNNQCKDIFYNILGRICHLLTDMGVPEHAKRSMHISHQNASWREPNGCSSPFESWLGEDDSRYNREFYWTAEKVYKERGGFVNPFCEINGDKNLYLFYTTAQLSDWFVSYGSRPSIGNDNYDSSIGEIESIIKSYYPSGDEYREHLLPFLGNVDNQWCLDDAHGRAFRDALLPYTIRAVAGMLYKFIIESKMQNRYGAPSETAGGSIFDQQQELILYNQDINGDYYTFRAEGNPGTITVCPDEIPEGYTKDFNPQYDRSK